MNTVAELKLAAKAMDWKACARLTRQALSEGKVVRWEANRVVRLDYAEWQAGDTPKFRLSSRGFITWSVWTTPSPVYRMGNSWTGGTASLIDAGDTVPGGSEDIEAFEIAMREVLK